MESPVTHGAPAPVGPQNLPWYRFIEVFDSNASVQERTSKMDRFPNGTLQNQPAFVATKSRLHQTISLQINSDTLRSKLLPLCLESSRVVIEFRDVVQAYIMLKAHCSSHQDDLEMKLLVEELLLDPKLYDGLDITKLRTLGAFSETLERDLYHNRINLGLDNIDVCFVLGQARDNPTPQYLPTFWRIMNRLVLEGDLDGLRRVCEPLVATKKIAWKHSNELLTRVLDQGRLDIFRYFMDLASRTTTPHGSCTFHPLYMAIRLGHLATVEKLVEKGELFQGMCTVESNGQATALPFTPLTAAAYWGQARVLRFLLRWGLASRFSAQEALNIAFSQQHLNIVQELQNSSYLLQWPAGYEHNAAYPTAHAIPDFFKHAQLSENTFQSVECSWGARLALNTFVDTTPTAFSSLNSGPSMFGDDCTSPSIKQEGDEPPSPVSSTSSGTTDAVRQELGFRLSTYLKDMCGKVRTHAIQCGRPDIGSRFSSFGQVWERGMEGFRRILRNKPPTSVRAVLDCLLLACAVCKAKHGIRDGAYQNFIDDLCCWRSVVPLEDQTIFDYICYKVWGKPVGPTTNQQTHELEHLVIFQRLLDKMVSTDDIPGDGESTPEESPVATTAPGDLYPLVSTSSGSGLSNLSGLLPGKLAELTQQENPVSNEWISWPSSDSFQASNGVVTPLEGLEWKSYTSGTSILPAVVRLLSSVAAGIIFSLLIVLQRGSETVVTNSVKKSPWDLGLACSLLKSLLETLLPIQELPPEQYEATPTISSSPLVVNVSPPTPSRQIGDPFTFNGWNSSLELPASSRRSSTSDSSTSFVGSVKPLVAPDCTSEMTGDMTADFASTIVLGADLTSGYLPGSFEGEQVLSPPELPR